MLYQGESAIYEYSDMRFAEKHSFKTDWGQYPVYAHNISTVRAIEVIKKLQERNALRAASQRDLFELVELIREQVS